MTQLWAYNWLSGTGQDPVVDLSGNGRDWTPTGNNTRTSAGGGYTYGGARPNAVGFHQTASDTQIVLSSMTGLNVSPRTVCGWAIITGSANGWVISMDRVDGGNPTGTGVFGIYNNSGSPQFRCKDNSGSAFTRSFTGNAAYRFYALTYDGTNLKVYQSDGSGVVAQVGANIAMGSVWDATRLLFLQQMGTGATLSDWQAFDTAMSLTQLQTLADTPLGGVNSTAAGQAAETDTAVAPGRIRATTAGTAAETDAGQPVGRIRATTVLPAPETDAAQTPGRIRTTLVGTALEVDTAQPLGAAHVTPAGTAAETDLALSPGRVRVSSAATAQETDSAQTPGRARTQLAGTALELDTAIGPSNPNAVVRDLDLESTLEPGRFITTVEPSRFRTEIAS